MPKRNTKKEGMLMGKRGFKIKIESMIEIGNYLPMCGKETIEKLLFKHLWDLLTTIDCDPITGYLKIEWAINRDALKGDEVY
jgi:hypothetical protein